MELLHVALQEITCIFGLRPRQDIAEWNRHIYRELNTEADALCNWAMDHAKSFLAIHPAFYTLTAYGGFNLLSWSDGARRDSGIGAQGFIIRQKTKDRWSVLVYAAFYSEHVEDSSEAEAGA